MRRPTHYGYLVVDHRNSPGIPDMPGYGPGQVMEADTQHCNHCHVPVILNPFRQRERFICPNCDWFLCDNCAIAFKINGICKPFEQVADEVQSGKLLLPILAKDIKE
jgi:hypothetical protein